MAFGGTPNETAPARLLIVEDDVLMATALEELLCTSGFEVVGSPVPPQRQRHWLESGTRS